MAAGASNRFDKCLDHRRCFQINIESGVGEFLQHLLQGRKSLALSEVYGGKFLCAELRDKTWPACHASKVRIVGDDDLTVFTQMHIGFEDVCTSSERRLERTQSIFGVIQS